MQTQIQIQTPASSPLPPGRPETEGGWRRGRLRLRAGSANLSHGGFREDDGDVEEREGKWVIIEIFASHRSSILSIYQLHDEVDLPTQLISIVFSKCKRHQSADDDDDDDDDQYDRLT